MSTPLDRAAGYTAALHDVQAALRLADHARKHGILCDFEQLIQQEISIRLNRRVESGELPPSITQQLLAKVAEQAAALAFPVIEEAR